MRIAIIGSNSFIGAELIKKFEAKNEVILINRNIGNELYLDLENVENFNFDDLKNVDYFIFTAAISNPDICDIEYEKSYQVNVTSTKIVIKKILESGSKVIFLSSDTVYDNSKGDSNFESFNVNPLSKYANMKLEIENTFRGYSNFKSIRLSYVIGINDKFTKYILKCNEIHTSPEIFHPLLRNVIMLNELVEIIDWLIKNWGNFSNQLLNVCGPHLVSRVDIYNSLKNIFNLDLQPNIIYPGRTFYNNRAELINMKSLFLKNIIDIEKYSFYDRMFKEFITTKEEI